ncbi:MULTISPECIES: SDR family oxidoreductase [unclassified Sporosarcina]|uniref:SDR family oxidoreductase n=1 Tax=unclassified Sporosarcina TaxID=2647733 RepID=UPI00210134CE|nr:MULTISPECIES: SDR family oxidoreductase [unclassified Sporosarcina]
MPRVKRNNDYIKRCTYKLLKEETKIITYSLYIPELFLNCVGTWYLPKTVETFGKLDFAHNNAGINKGLKPIGEMDSKDWDIRLQVNLYGTFYCIKHEVNAMLKNGWRCNCQHSIRCGH